MAELNGGQLAILLQNWNHPVIKPFLATAATGLAAIAVYERGLPIDLDIKRLNHFVAHLAAPELGRGLYVPEKEMSPYYPVSEIFGLLEPELFSAAKITARTSAPELLGILDHIGSHGAIVHLQITPDLSGIVNHIGNDSTHAHFQATSHLITPAPVLPSHTSGASHTTAPLPISAQAQTAIANGSGSILGLAATVVVSAVAGFSAYKTYKTYRNNKKAEAQKLTDAQLIAHLILQLDDIRASKLEIETALKAAENDLSKSNNDKYQLWKQVSGLTTEHDQPIQALEEAKEESRRKAKLVHETIKRLEAEQERAAELERDRNTQIQANNNLQDELFEAHSTVSVLQDEKSAREREDQEQLQAVRLENDDLSSQVQSADVDKIKLMEQLQAARLENGDLSLQLQSVNADKTKLEEQLAASELAANAVRQQMEAKIDELDLQNTDHEIRAVSAEEELAELKKQMVAAKADLHTKQNQLHELDDRNGHLESTLASAHDRMEELTASANSAREQYERELKTLNDKYNFQSRKLDQKDIAMEELRTYHHEALAALVAAQIAAEQKSKLQQENECLEQQLQEKNREAEVMHQQKREADDALKMTREKLAQLEKKKTTSDFSKLGILKIDGKDYNDDDLGHHATGSNDGSLQGSLQQQDRPSGTSESPPNTTTTEEVVGEHSPMPMTKSHPPFGELNLPNRKRREAWHSHWNTRNMKRVYRDDVVYTMELPCFDAWFNDIGIALPAENHEDRTLESGKVREHTKCNHCLQWYTKKDMYDHLKTCKAFWELAIRCGHCKEIFKYNTAFFDQHVPDCKAQSTEEDSSEKHYTLANFGVDATTIQTSQQAGLSSSASISPGKQINPDAPLFTLGGSTLGLELPIPTGPRYPNPNFQQARGTPFNGPQVAHSTRSMPYMTPRGISPAHGSGFGTPSPAARPPTGPQAYSAPRDSSRAYGSPGQQQQGRPQTPENSFPFSPGYAGRK